MGTKIAHRMKTLLLGLISLAVLAGLVWGLYTVLARLVAHLMTLSPNVAASIIAVPHQLWTRFQVVDRDRCADSSRLLPWASISTCGCLYPLCLWGVKE